MGWCRHAGLAAGAFGGAASGHETANDEKPTAVEARAQCEGMVRNFSSGAGHFEGHLLTNSLVHMYLSVRAAQFQGNKIMCFLVTNCRLCLCKIPRAF